MPHPERRTRPAVLLLMDADPGYVRELHESLGSQYTIEAHTDAHAALTLLEAGRCAAVLLDLDGGAGFELLRRIRRRDESVPVIVLARQATVAAALQVGRLGATDYVSKSLAPERLLQRIDAALRLARIQRDRGGPRRARPRFIGASDQVRRLLEEAEAAAAADTGVLITGESGTGKEALARFVHEHSPRSRGLFVTVNCAALPDAVAESTLFGHESESGGRPGVVRKGSVELADRGTLFLDDLSELPPALQSKLHRAIETGEYQRVGSGQQLSARTSPIASSSRDLEACLARGALRPELFYRINVVRLRVPPLRERREDVLLLARHFLRRKAAELGKPVETLNRDAEAILLAHEWPGNARELENVIERAVVLARSPTIGAELLSPICSGAEYLSMSWDQARDGVLRRFERSYLTALLQVHRGGVSTAAAAMGVSRQAFYKALERTGLDPASFRRGRRPRTK